ncbi:MAG: 50S ribosomal protein L25 [Proteobacteria bacterium]|nr:50S ribosomal protein L25 [Pseudomonadota bacterium]
MQRVRLDVSERTQRGKGVARKLRAEGRIPAVMYGSGVPTLPLAVNAQELDKIEQGGTNALLDLSGPEAVAGKIVLLKDLQRDPVKRVPLHCDFYVIDPKKEITVYVQIHLQGRPVGVELGGVLEPQLRDLEISCLPLGIPDSIDVDVSSLDIGDAIRVSDLDLPEGVSTTAEPERSVAHVIAARVIEEEEEAEGEPLDTEEGDSAEEASPEADGGGDAG